jgi:hypothetical protein
MSFMLSVAKCLKYSLYAECCFAVSASKMPFMQNVIMLNVIMLNVVYAECLKYALYAECRYAECRLW